MLYICNMKGSKVKEIAQNLKITAYIERRRVESRKSIESLSGVMGISRYAYKRRLGSVDGFTEREIHLAASELGIDVKAEVRL